MELRQLENFLIVAECSSIARATTITGVAQPVLSRSIRQLEADIGATLFYRDGRGVRLTDEGHRFRTAVAPLVRELNQAREDIRGAAGVPAGHVTIAMPPSLSRIVGVRLIDLVMREYPQVKLTIMDGYSAYRSEWLFSGRVDMAIINSARCLSTVRMDPLHSVYLVHFGKVADFDPDARSRPSVTLAELAAHPLVLPTSQHGIRRQLDAAAQAAGVTLNVAIEIDSAEGLIDIAGRGIASTILPLSLLTRFEQSDEVCMRKIVDPEVTIRFMLAYSAQRPVSSAMREIGHRIRTEIREAIADGRLAGCS